MNPEKRSRNPSMDKITAVESQPKRLSSIQFNPNHAVPLLIMNVRSDPKKVFSQLHGRLTDNETVTGRCMDFEKGEVG